MKNKTIYITRKRLLRDLDLINDYFINNSATWILQAYPNCKYYIFDPNIEKFKPSKRGLKNDN